MATKDTREVWQRGPIADVPALLQPVAHALLQAREETETLMENFPDALLFEKPAGVASPAFHLQHLSGVLDRLFTYANAQQISEEQLQYLSREGRQQQLTTAGLVAAFAFQIHKATNQLKATNESKLTEVRGVGRAQIPSTVIGLYVHAAEHTMRHIGQLRVTVNVLLALQKAGKTI